MKTKLLTSTRGQYSNRTWFPENAPAWDKAYYTLYSSAAGKLPQNTLDAMVEALLSADEGQTELPLALRAERILDQFRLNEEQYLRLLDLLPLKYVTETTNNIGYRFLIHPNISDETFQIILDRVGNDRERLVEFQKLTESCIRHVINQFTKVRSYTYRWTPGVSANVLTLNQYTRILRVLQKGEKKLDERL
jgi:hypothetical protein